MSATGWAMKSSLGGFRGGTRAEFRLALLHLAAVILRASLARLEEFHPDKLHASPAKERPEKARKRGESCFKIHGLWFADSVDPFVPEDFSSSGRHHVAIPVYLWPI